MLARTLCVLALAAAAYAQNCSQTSVGLTPINDLGAAKYLGQFEGGLYPFGQNAPPPGHANAGVVRTLAVQPLSLAGQPAGDGKIVLLSIGMSNTTQEFCSQSGNPPCDPWTFTGQALVHPDVNQDSLVIANGAKGGQAAATWDSPLDQNYDRVRDQVLAPMGLSEAQVQVVWIKVANAQPQVSLPAPNADAYALLTDMGEIARAVRIRYPNIKVAFVSSRIYAGYATTALNPEPYAYESGFAVKWLIQAQIKQMQTGLPDPLAGDLNFNTVAPWLAWGPYLWADGLTPRSDGLIWKCLDLQSDGTHPAQPGEEKVGGLLLDFMLNSPFAIPWFRDITPGDLNYDGVVGQEDLGILLASYKRCAGQPGFNPVADIDKDGCVDQGDLGILLGNYGKS